MKAPRGGRALPRRAARAVALSVLALMVGSCVGLVVAGRAYARDHVLTSDWFSDTGITATVPAGETVLLGDEGGSRGVTPDPWGSSAGSPRRSRSWA